MGSLYEDYFAIDMFSLRDAAFLFRDLHPGRPGTEITESTVRLVAEELVRDRNHLQARFVGEEDQRGDPDHWIAARENLKAWARRTNLRPSFLFPLVPELVTIYHFIREESYKVGGTQKHLVELGYFKARERVAQEILNGKLKAYVYDSEGDPKMVSGDHEYMQQIRIFLREGEKYKRWTEYSQFLPHLDLDQPPRAHQRSRVINLDWVSSAYIPVGQESKIQEHSDFADDPRWPEELGIAMTAWRAAINQVREDETPKSFMRNWLEQNYPGRSNEFYDRVTIVANWDKSPGAKKKK